MTSSRPPFFPRLVLLATLVASPVVAQIPAPPKAAENQAAKDLPAADKPPAPIWRTYDFQVVSRQDTPVVGATIRPWSVGHGRGSQPGDARFHTPLKTDAEGKFQIVIHKDEPFIPYVEAYGIESLSFQVDHPDYPLWHDDVPVDGDRKIVVPDPVTIRVRVRPAEGTEIPRDLYPVPPTSDWSEKDGVVTIRRVDLASNRASPWLRIVQAPEQGPQCFSDLINIREHRGPTISLDTQLKPGVRIAAYLAENVPRPITSGRVQATVVSGGQPNPWRWPVAADIDPDGTFVFESLPAGETVQIIALCEGWVSASITSKEVEEYDLANNLAIALQHDKAMQVRNRVFPRLHRLTPPQIEPRIPMEATLSCLVTVLDDNGVPIPNATVSCWPNQYWFDGGLPVLGYEMTWLSTLRRPGDKAAGDPVKQTWAARYEQETDAGGRALLTGLPFALGPAATLTRQYRFDVSHDHYTLATKAGGRRLPLDEAIMVKVEPGQVGQITVRMQPK